jgi:hypothetical protein
MKKYFVALLMLLVSAAAGNAYAGPDEWTYGIGTGIFGLNIKGSMGFSANPGSNHFWPEVNGELNQSKTSDLMETAFGFGGYANKGDWTILYKVGQMKLSDTAHGDSPGGIASLDAEVSFTGKNAEVDGVYAFAKTGDNYWGALGGLRYYNQRITLNITTNPPSAISGTYDKSASWTDAVVGITHKMPFSKTVVWHNQADIAGGGTKGTYHINTGVGWQFYDGWSADFYGNYIRYNYEKGTKGSSDNWYLYKAAEYGVGATVMYNW